MQEQRLLDTYTFLGPAHVFLRLPDEDEVGAQVFIHMSYAGKRSKASNGLSFDAVRKSL